MATTDIGAGFLRLPADRRSAVRPGPFAEDPAAVALAFLGLAVRGDLDALATLFVDSAEETLRRLSALRGRRVVEDILKRNGRSILDCRVERLEELPSGTAECRLRLFRLLPGGQIDSCCWLVQLRHEGKSWKIAGFDRLPGYPPP